MAKRQTDRDSTEQYRSRATVPLVVPGTGRLADGHVVQWSMDGFHNAQSPLSTNFLDGDSAPASADFARMRNRDQTAWTEQLGITLSDPVKFRRAAAEPGQTSSASDVAVGARLPGDLADVHPMLKPSTIVSTASPPLGLRPAGVPTVDTACPRSYINPLSRVCGTGPPLTSPGTHETFNATVHGRDQEQEASDIAGDGLIIHSSR